MLWKVASPIIPDSLSDLRRILLENRALDEASDFFSPRQPIDLSLKDVGLDAKQLQIALERLKVALKNHQKIIIFGDYDADGVCATAILWKILHQLKFEVLPFIPQRESHGYGLSLPALKDILKKSAPDLIITVDNGIVAHSAAQFLQNQGIDLIITDHHQAESELPPAMAVVHSTKLCGATVSWMFSREIGQHFGQPIQPHWQLDLAGLATIADQVSILGVNRSFAYHGLIELKNTSNLGLQALMTQAQLKPSEIDEHSVGFALVPRINAMGRLEHSLDALRLVLTSNPARADKLAQVLAKTNQTRQELTYSMYDQAKIQAKEWQDEHLIIVSSPDFHEGVVGLIAGRLMEKYHKPTIVLSLGDEIVRGSARSIPGVNIVELIRQVQDELLEVGGHPMAAGFGLDINKLNSVIKRLKKIAKETIDIQLLQPVLEIDTVLPPHLVKPETIKLINEFAPFGQQNPPPLFVMENLNIISTQTIGQEGTHLKILATLPESVVPLELLYWRHGYLANQLNPDQIIQVVGKLELNTWKNKSKVQVVVSDLNYL